MASPRAANPGRTARYYRSHPKARAKHNADNNTGGKHAHTKEYKKAHSKARRSMGIMGKGGKDVVKGKSGKLTSRQSVKANRGKK
jgi:hypothetical protein